MATVERTLREMRALGKDNRGTGPRTKAGGGPGESGSQEVTGRMLHVVLVEPEIHWNTGNAGRTCLAVGAQLHLVEPLGFSLDEREVRRAGLDYWERVCPRVWKSWDEIRVYGREVGSPAR